MQSNNLYKSITSQVEEYKKSNNQYAAIPLYNKYAKETINSVSNLLLYSDSIVSIDYLAINNSSNINIKDISYIDILFITDSIDINITNSKINNLVIINSRITINGRILQNIEVRKSSILNVSSCTIDLSDTTSYKYAYGINVKEHSVLNINLSDIISEPDSTVNDIFYLSESNLNISASSIEANNNNYIFNMYKSKLVAKRLHIITDENAKLLYGSNNSSAEFYDLFLNHKLDSDIFDTSEYRIFTQYNQDENILEVNNLAVNSISTNIKHITNDYTVKSDDHTLIVESPVNIKLSHELIPGTIIVIVNNSGKNINIIGNINNNISLILAPNKKLTLQYSAESDMYHIIKLDYELYKCSS